MIGKKLHITDLFDIPSTLKSQEEKLKDKFILLRGFLIAGNNNPELLRKFKIVLLKMKNNKLVSLQEYNEVLNILLQMEI
jgi:predicted esterase